MSDTLDSLIKNRGPIRTIDVREIGYVGIPASVIDNGFVYLGIGCGDKNEQQIRIESP